MKSGIYYIKSPSNKYYIGSTNNFKRRKKQYARASCKAQKKLYNSIIKYGWESHEWGILDHCSEDVLIEREQMCIDFYKPELNLNPIAAKPPSWLGKKRSEETKRKISMTLKNKKKKPFTKKHIKNLSKSLINNNRRSKTVLQYSKDGVFIAEYISAAKASKELGILQSNITGVCRNERKSTGGFIFKYKENK